jgi:CelD/BcsL family acetyltransferase involved in cellulose biosynthesis
VGSGTLNNVEVKVFGSFPEAAPVWRRFEEGGICYVFQTYDWLSTWFHHVGRHSGVVPCLVSVDSAAAGQLLFLPLGIEKRGFVSCISWLGGRITDYHAPIIGAGYASFRREFPFRDLWANIRGFLPPFDVICLERQPEFIEEVPNPFFELGCLPEAFAAHALALPRRWLHLYEEKCSSKTRAKERRREKRLSSLGEVVFEQAAPAEQVEPVMDRLIELSTIRYDKLATTNIFEARGVRDFFINLGRCRDMRLCVYLSSLRIGERIVAAHWGVEFRGRFYYLLPAFEEGVLGELSPGSVLCRRLLQWACESGVKVFDFTIGDESYKLRWCDTTLSINIWSRRR